MPHFGAVGCEVNGGGEFGFAAVFGALAGQRVVGVVLEEEAGGELWLGLGDEGAGREQRGEQEAVGKSGQHDFFADCVSDGGFVPARMPQKSTRAYAVEGKKA